MKNQVGIWLDYREAWIIVLHEEQPDIYHLNSEIETGTVKGGSRSRQPWGPMDKTSESKMLERRKNEEQRYFKKIAETVTGAGEIYIFGPAGAKDGLVKFIKSHQKFTHRLRAVETADNMTINQKIAKVERFFETGPALT